jgi:hypothetical protein
MTLTNSYKEMTTAGLCLVKNDKANTVTGHVQRKVLNDKKHGFLAHEIPS